MPSIVCLFFLKMCLLEGSSTLTNSVHLLFVNLGNPIYYLPHLCLSSPVLPSHGAWVPWAFLVAQMVENLQCRRLRFNPWVRKIPWRREWQSTLVFLPSESHGQRSLAGYHPWGCKESDMHTLKEKATNAHIKRKKNHVLSELKKKFLLFL